MSITRLAHTYATPVVLGVGITGGLLAALLFDGGVEWFALAALAAPLVAIASSLGKESRR